jgi:hypothetical protein
MSGNATPGTNVWTAWPAPNKFGSSPKDSNREAIPYANAILTQDYTGRALSTPDPSQDVTSPTANLSTNAIALVIPPNAVTMTMQSTAAFQFSEVGPAGGALSQSYAQPAGVPITINVARQKFIYVTGTAALNFFFQTL